MQHIGFPCEGVCAGDARNGARMFLESGLGVCLIFSCSLASCRVWGASRVEAPVALAWLAANAPLMRLCTWPGEGACRVPMTVSSTAQQCSVNGGGMCMADMTCACGMGCILCTPRGVQFCMCLQNTCLWRALAHINATVEAARGVHDTVAD